MLRLRLISAAILVSGIVLFLILDASVPLFGVGGLWLLPAGLFIVGGTAWEFATLTRDKYGVERIWILIATTTMFLMAAAPMFYEVATGEAYPEDCPIGLLGWPLMGVMFSCSAFCLLAMRKFDQLGERTIDYWCMSNLITVYVGGGGSFFLLIRQLTPSWWGIFWLVTVIAIPKLGDCGAFFVGRRFGKKKLCPSISPGKTIAGAVGAIAFGAIASLFAFCVIAPWLAEASVQLSQVVSAIVFGIVMAVVGMIGDLAESLVKRSMSTKDSGQLLPGLGGVWDVSDSLLPTAVCGYLLIAVDFIELPV